jgi:glucose-1-phosphate cytidylyltransferase
MSNLVINAQVPVVILCGGLGIYIDDTGIRRNKALVAVDGEPMVIQVMRLYVRAGYRTFVLAAGYQSDILAAVLATAHSSGADASDPDLFEITINGAPCAVRVVRSADTATTGDRLLACRQYLEPFQWFCVTYSDTLSDVNLTDMQRFHCGHGKVATLMAAEYPTRFRILGIRLGETKVSGFAARPVLGMEPINGGFYFFSNHLFDDRFLGSKPNNSVLEDEPLERLASAQELMAFAHQGAWQNLDSERDLVPLTRILRSMRS